jgi:hypothetical protein
MLRESSPTLSMWTLQKQISHIQILISIPTFFFSNPTNKTETGLQVGERHHHSTLADSTLVPNN